MDIIKILKEHFAESMTPETEDKIKTAFELAISEKVTEKKDEIRAELEEEMKADVEKGLADLVEKVDLYIETANTEFIEENLKNVESSAKVELAEKLTEGIINSLKENNMNIAIEDRDVVEGLELENKKLEKNINEAVDKIEEGKKQALEYEKAITLMTMSEALTDTQKEKLNLMLEDVSVKDIEEFKTKVTTGIDIIKDVKLNEDGDDISGDDIIDENFSDKKSELDQYAPKW